MLATLSQATTFSLSCYCEWQARCHRGRLPELLDEAGAKLVD